MPLAEVSRSISSALINSSYYFYLNKKPHKSSLMGLSCVVSLRLSYWFSLAELRYYQSFQDELYHPKFYYPPHLK